MAAVYTCLTRRVLQVDYGFSVNMSYTRLLQVAYGFSVYLSYDALVASGLWLQCIPV